jgi:anaerobic C4-dicarboxylate transporter
LLTVSRSFMNVANSVLWRMAIILKANRVNLFVSSILFVVWYHSPNLLYTPRMSLQLDCFHCLITYILQAGCLYVQVTKVDSSAVSKAQYTKQMQEF